MLTLCRASIVDSDDAVRGDIESLIDCAPGFSVLESARRVEDLSRASVIQPDVVLLDPALPREFVYGREAIQDLVERGLRVLVFSIDESENAVLVAIAAGGHGYLSKRGCGPQILHAMHEVAANRIYLSQEVAGHLHKVTRNLTSREHSVLELVIAGEPTATIAGLLHLSESRVNATVERIRYKSDPRRKG